MGGREIPVEEQCPPDCAVCHPGKPPAVRDNGTVRTFASGATRDTSDGKLDFEAFFSPLVLLRYAEYMHKNRTRSDGTLRDGDDWQQGMDHDEYMKSLQRHNMDAWLIHRGYPDDAREDIVTALCGIIFNAMGYLHEIEEGRTPWPAGQAT